MKKSIKRLVCALLALMMTVTLCACGKSDGSEVIKIGVVIYRGDDAFINNMMNCLNGFAKDMEQETGKRLNLSIIDSQNSQTTQNDQAERLISLDYDVLCVNLVDRTSASSIIETAMYADVPVVFFNREPVQDDLQKWDKLYYVGTDAEENGRLEGQIIVEAYKKDPKKIDRNGDGILQYIMIEGEGRHQDAVLRTENSIKTLRDAGIKVEKIDGGIANWERSQAAALCGEYFDKYGDAIEVVICNNDDMALGVTDALERLGLDFSNIVGIDGMPKCVEKVNDGKILGTVAIDAEAQAKIVLDIAVALAQGESAETVAQVPEDKCIRAKCYIITADNQ